MQYPHSARVFDRKSPFTPSLRLTTGDPNPQIKKQAAAIITVACFLSLPELMQSQPGVISRPNIRLSSRLEGIEIVGSQSACIYPGQCPQPGTVYPPGVVVHSTQAGLLSAIYP